MNKQIVCMTLLGSLLLCGCAKAKPATETTLPISVILPTDAPTQPTETQAPTQATLPLPIPTMPAQPTDPTQPVPTTPATTAPTTKPTAGVVTVTKSPTAETTDEGGSAVFVARADNAEQIVWIVVSPDTKTVYELNRVPAAFEGLEISGQGTEVLRLSNIPYAMDGWRIQCYFVGNGGPVYTSGANLTVRQKQPDTYEGIIARYRTAITEGYNAAKMQQMGLNYMIPECLAQDERANVGFCMVDLNGDGEQELVIGAQSESEFYTGLIFELYTQDEGKVKRILGSTERDRWYYAGMGQLLNVGSSSAAQSGWYLHGTDSKLTGLMAAEYNAVDYPNNPWRIYDLDGWEHVTQEEAEQRRLELCAMVSNLNLTPFV